MEDIAADYLSERGVKILERNFRSKEAELDIIGTADGTILFVEVKARREGKKSGAAAEAVGPAKQKRICRCADYYMHNKGIDPFRTSVRFDVVAITVENAADPDEETDADAAVETDMNVRCRIRWIKNAFPYSTYSRTGPHWRVW